MSTGTAATRSWNGSTMSTRNPHTAARRSAEVQFEPYADCLSKTAAGSPCLWESPTSPHTLTNAKHHAADKNHRVRVVWERVATYRRDDYDPVNDQEEGG